MLQADPAHAGHPPGADPLNIRDRMNWLDPWIELDRERLLGEVRGKLGPLIADAPGWALGLDRRGTYTWASHFHEARTPGGGRFLMMLRAEGQPLTLSRKTTIEPSDRWLAVHLGLVAALALLEEPDSALVEGLPVPRVQRIQETVTLLMSYFGGETVGDGGTPDFFDIWG